MHSTNRSHVSSLDLFYNQLFCAVAGFPRAYWSSVCLYLRNVLRARREKKKTTSYHVKTEAGLSENSFVFFPRTGFKDVICVRANQEKHVKGIEPETGRGAAGEKDG